MKTEKKGINDTVGKLGHYGIFEAKRKKKKIFKQEGVINCAAIGQVESRPRLFTG